MNAKLVSIQVGRPREVEWRGELVRTSIWKEPVAGRVRVGALNLAGDEQSDLSVHGGADKAIYAYPREHYPYWRGQLPEAELAWGAFGENLTTEGVDESTLRIGERLRIGSAELLVTQPRLPCFKLGIRFGRADMVKRFQRSGRSGFYLRVLREGELGAGDPIERFTTEPEALSVADIFELYGAAHPDPERLRRASELTALPEGWRAHFRARSSRGG